MSQNDSRIYLTFVAEHSLPAWLADALQALVAVPVDATRKTNTLFAKLT